MTGAQLSRSGAGAPLGDAAYLPRRPKQDMFPECPHHMAAGWENEAAVRRSEASPTPGHPPASTEPAGLRGRQHPALPRPWEQSPLPRSQGTRAVSASVFAVSTTLFFLACCRHVQRPLFRVPAGACHTASGHVTYFFSGLCRSAGRPCVWKLTEEV